MLRGTHADPLIANVINDVDLPIIDLRMRVGATYILRRYDIYEIIMLRLSPICFMAYSKLNSGNGT